jgi:hypothetical protein
MDYFGVKELLAPGLVMPLLDSDKRRAKRADFCKRFSERPYFLIRAKNPLVLFDQLEEVLDKNKSIGASASA